MGELGPFCSRRSRDRIVRRRWRLSRPPEGRQEVADAIAAAIGCAKRRIVVIVVHLLRRLV
jgi:hypothetical protein